MAGAVVAALALGLGIFFWRRKKQQRKNALGRLSLLGSDEKLPNSGLPLPPPPEPWHYTGMPFQSYLSP